MNTHSLLSDETAGRPALKTLPAPLRAWLRLPRTGLPALLATTLLTATLQADPPVLDLRISDGMVEDKSSHQRQVQVTQALLDDNGKDMRLSNLTSVLIDYAEGDPLFGAEAFTYIIRCKFGSLDPYPAKPFFFMGRWDILNDGRVLGLSFNQEGAGATFAISQASELTEKPLHGISLPELPGDAWIVLVGLYEPGQTLKIQLYNADGELLSSQKAKYVPPQLHKASTPFAVGCIPEVQMQIGRALVWNRCLEDSDVQDEVDKITK